MGNTRATLDLDYLGDDLQKDDWQISLERLARERNIELEAVLIDRFIPLPEGGSQRHILFQQYNQLSVYIYDPYAIALSKIDRGFDSDIDDLVFLVQAEIIDLDRLAEILSQSLKHASKFDLDPRSALQHLESVRSRLSAQ